MKYRGSVVLIPHGIQEHYSVGYANAVVDAGFEVDFISSENIDDGLLDDRIQALDFGLNKNADRSPLEKARRFLAYHGRLLLFGLRRRRSIIHVIGLLRHELVTGLLEGLTFRLFCRRYILTVHNLIPHDSNQRRKRALYRVIYRLPHRLIVHTDRMRRELIRDYGVDPDKIMHMVHGLNDETADVTQDASELRRAMGIEPTAPVLLFFGKLAPYKGLDILLQALNDLPEACLLIAGKADDGEYGHYIQSLLDTHPARSRIIPRIGWVDNEDIPAFFTVADALVLPYRHIDQTGVLFLSLRYGLPIVAFDVGDLREYITGEVGVIVAEQTPQALAEGIQRFLAARDSYSRNRIQGIADQYRWEYVVEPVIQEYANYLAMEEG